MQTDPMSQENGVVRFVTVAYTQEKKKLKMSTPFPLDALVDVDSLRIRMDNAKDYSSAIILLESELSRLQTYEGMEDFIFKLFTLDHGNIPTFLLDELAVKCAIKQFQTFPRVQLFHRWMSLVSQIKLASSVTKYQSMQSLANADIVSARKLISPLSDKESRICKQVIENYEILQQLQFQIDDVQNFSSKVKLLPTHLQYRAMAYLYFQHNKTTSNVLNSILSYINTLPQRYAFADLLIKTSALGDEIERALINYKNVNPGKNDSLYDCLLGKVS